MSAHIGQGLGEAAQLRPTPGRICAGKHVEFGPSASQCGATSGQTGQCAARKPVLSKFGPGSPLLARLRRNSTKGCPASTRVAQASTKFARIRTDLARFRSDLLGQISPDFDQAWREADQIRPNVGGDMVTFVSNLTCCPDSDRTWAIREGGTIILDR